MSNDDMADHSSGTIQMGVGGYQTLTVTKPEGIEIIARLRETQGDIKGRAFLLNLDQIIVRLGAKWEMKEDLVREHLRTSFAHRLHEPNWCAQILDNAWLASAITATARDGALKCAEIWQETGQFFVGDISDTQLPLFEVIVESADCLKLRPIDLDTYYDRGEGDDSGRSHRPQDGAHVNETAHENLGVGTMTPIERASQSGSPIFIGGRELRVACALQPVFELKTLSLIGYRMEPLVVDMAGHVQLNSKALKGMDWGDREKVDLANIEQGLHLLRLWSAKQRKLLMVVPVAFSTLASARCRARATAEISKAAAEMGMKVLYEIRGLDGVPSSRIVEIVSMIKPYCMTVVGHVGAELRTIQAVKNCGFSGVCLTYDGLERNQTELQDYLTELSTAAKVSAGACMIQGFNNLRQMAIARLAGVSHASVNASALQTAGARH